jgi:hypothetical protein
MDRYPRASTQSLRPRAGRARRVITLRVILASAVAAASLAAIVPAAEADPTRVTGGGEQSNDYKLVAAPGTANNISVSLAPDPLGGFDYVFTDSAGLVTPLYLSCHAPDGGNAAVGVHDALICATPFLDEGSSFVVKVEAGDGNDRVDMSFGKAPGFNNVAQIIQGEGGNDKLSASGPPLLVSNSFLDPVLDGGPGNDVLRSGSNHKLKGRGGIDRIFARNGVRNLKISCGPGSNKREVAKVDRKDPKPKSC